jgi:hypothetical protein
MMHPETVVFLISIKRKARDNGILTHGVARSGGES